MASSLIQPSNQTSATIFWCVFPSKIVSSFYCDNIIVKRRIPSVLCSHGDKPFHMRRFAINKVNKCVTCKQSWILMILVIKCIIGILRHAFRTLAGGNILQNFFLPPWIKCPYCRPRKLGLASGSVIQVRKNKCCKERTITTPPNGCHIIPF